MSRNMVGAVVCCGKKRFRDISARYSTRHRQGQLAGVFPIPHDTFQSAPIRAAIVHQEWIDPLDSEDEMISVIFVKYDSSQVDGARDDVVENTSIDPPM